jgi:RNA polymerase sigma-70 factor (ECF subfamily)
MSSSLDDVGTLYAREHRRLERRAARRVGVANAADVVQDVFVAFWSRARDHIGCQASYLSRAIDYAAISHQRAERRRASLPLRITEEQYAARSRYPIRLRQPARTWSVWCGPSRPCPNARARSSC